MNYELYMRAALSEAGQAAQLGERADGAVAVLDEAMVAHGRESVLSTGDPTAHAVLIVVREAATRLGRRSLAGTTVFCVVEPCAMCVGALVHARIGTLIYGAPEPKTGAVRSTMKLLDDPSWNHRVVVVAGLMAEESRALLQEFFQRKRRAGRE